MDKWFRRPSVFLGLGLCAVSLLHAGTAYTSDSNLADFTGQVLQYATFTNFFNGEAGSSPYTPTAANVASGLRIYQGGTLPGLTGDDWILASFTAPVSTILVFPNIDHSGDAYDGYQYVIAGSNNGTNWTPLFDVQSVTGSGEPFTLGLFTGTAPTSVNNVLTPGHGTGGTVGYEALFSFGSAYRYYAFGASTAAVGANNPDQELSAVASVRTAAAAPEPGSYLLLGAGLLSIALAGRRKLFS